jgi:predicted AAA+ superfamily ATPase
MPVEIFPFSFREFLQYNGLFQEVPATYGAKTASMLRKAAKDYLEIGGFPEVQGLERNLRLEVLQGYVDAVLLKDIIERHSVGNVRALKHMVLFAMSAPGGKFSVNKFYNTLKSMAIKCTKNNLYDYLDHLVDAFVFSKIPVHTRSEKARLINPNKIYTVDTGLLNAMTFRNSSDYGPMLENMVYMHLRRKGDAVEYVRTKDGYETDFLVRSKSTGELELIQSCWDISDEKTFEREFRGLKSAMAELGLPKGTIVTWDDEMAIEDDIYLVPAWKWLLN